MRLFLSLVCVFRLFAQSGLEGSVRSPDGAPVSGARIELRSAAGALLELASSGEDGRFSFRGGAPGMRLVIRKEGFSLLEAPAERGASYVLGPAAPAVSITVTARAGLLETTADAAQLVWQSGRQDGETLLPSTVGHRLEQAPGILVQETTPGQVSPFLRGLTGYHVVQLVDGVRFNNSTFRSGPNQYLAFFEPSQAERVEAMLGPSGAQYGSDGLGGTIQLLTTSAEFTSSSRWQRHGFLLAGGQSADWSATGQAEGSLASQRIWLLGGVHGARHQNMRAGGGLDSHNVLRRLLGLEPWHVRELLGSRLRDTAWSRTGLYGKAAARPGSRDLITGWLQHSDISGVRGYKDLWGGLGWTRSEFRPQALDFGYARWERFGGKWLDSISAGISWNRMRDGGIRQGQRASDPVIVDESRVRVLGWQVQGQRRFGRHTAAGFQAETYRERISSSRLQNGLPVRPLYPQARYRTAALAGHGFSEIAGRRLRLGYGARWTGVRFRSQAEPRFGVTESDLEFSQWTWTVSAVWRVAPQWALHAGSSLGFRAPNLNDLGALGLNDLGFEIPVRDALGWRPLLATNASEAAVSKGTALRALVPERVHNVEAGWRGTWAGFEARAQVFQARLEDPIVRRTLLFDAARVPDSLSGIPVTRLAQTPQQAAQGVVAVSTPFDPRAVKAFVNDGQAEYRGVETLFRWRVNSRWSARGAYSFLTGNDLEPRRPVRRLPPQAGHLALRRESGRRWWAEAGLLAAGAQHRLSGGDLDDERIGAAFSRRDIHSFFSASRLQPFLDAEGRFLPTGETAEQAALRVLPLSRAAADTQRVPLFTATPGWVRLDLHAGWTLGEFWLFQAGVSNVLDRNFRVHGSGVDAPGRSIQLSLTRRW